MIFARRRRLPLLSRYILVQRYAHIQPFLGRRVLDVGCSNAYLASLLPADAEYIGLDGSPALLEQGRRFHPGRRLVQLDLERDELPADIRDSRFDTVAMMALLEHLAAPAALVAALAPLLSPGGRLIITTPSPLGHRVHRAGAALGLFYHEAANDHRSMLSLAVLRGLAAAAGLEIEVCRTFALGCNQLLVARRPG
ncbi:MAG TPA: methyltransferase domain-containing protein [Herpetosiphonaceae bacterium]